VRHILTAPAGPLAPGIGLFVAQLEDQSRRLTLDTRGLTRSALEWQPAPGMNTMGMLLAHLAIVEVHWMQVGPLERALPDVAEALGIGVDDDGMPQPPRGKPPAALRGKPLAFFDDLLARARAHTVRVAGGLTDADLDREVSRVRKNGQTRVFNLRWVFYHMLEHYAGHYGQILLLHHLHRATHAKPRR